MCSNLFHALRPAAREKSLCFSMNWYHLSSSSPWHIWEHLGGENLSQQAERDTQPLGLWGFHLQSQQVSGCIPLLRAGSAQGCAARLVSGTEELAAPKSLVERA